LIVTRLDGGTAAVVAVEPPPVEPDPDPEPEPEPDPDPEPLPLPPDEAPPSGGGALPLPPPPPQAASASVNAIAPSQPGVPTRDFSFMAFTRSGKGRAPRRDAGGNLRGVPGMGTTRHDLDDPQPPTLEVGGTPRKKLRITTAIAGRVPMSSWLWNRSHLRRVAPRERYRGGPAAASLDSAKSRNLSQRKARKASYQWAG
jgi:hypothetical protein